VAAPEKAKEVVEEEVAEEEVAEEQGQKSQKTGDRQDSSQLEVYATMGTGEGVVNTNSVVTAAVVVITLHPQD